MVACLWSLSELFSFHDQFKAKKADRYVSMGTNNEAVRNDPLYIGLKQPRVGLEEATEFMDAFMAAASEAFPKAVIQHEDFYSEAAFDFLARYKEKYRMFNDDIEGQVDVFFRCCCLYMS